MTSKRSSESDLALLCPPMIPLKQHVTLGSSDTSKELHSLLKKHSSGSSHLTSSSRSEYQDHDFFPSLPNTIMSQSQVSKIFFRERFNIGSDGRFSRKSNFVEDMQALFDQEGFDANELEEHFNDDEENEDPITTTTATTNDTKPSTSNLLDGSNVSFGGVEIREYPIIPGDSPAGFKGCPLTIGWKSVSTVKIAHLDKYECQDHRRKTKELSIPAAQRMDILRNQGFCRSEIQASIKLANIGRRQRRETMATLKHQAAYETLEVIQRKTMNILTLGRRSRAKKEYLKKYVPSYGVVVQH